MPSRSNAPKFTSGLPKAEPTGLYHHSPGQAKRRPGLRMEERMQSEELPHRAAASYEKALRAQTLSAHSLDRLSIVPATESNSRNSHEFCCTPKAECFIG